MEMAVIEFCEVRPQTKSVMGMGQQHSEGKTCPVLIKLALVTCYEQLSGSQFNEA